MPHNKFGLSLQSSDNWSGLHGRRSLYLNGSSFDAKMRRISRIGFPEFDTDAVNKKFVTSHIDKQLHDLSESTSANILAMTGVLRQHVHEISLCGDGNFYDAKMRRISNVTPPEAANDVVNKQYFESNVTDLYNLIRNTNLTNINMSNKLDEIVYKVNKFERDLNVMEQKFINVSRVITKYLGVNPTTLPTTTTTTTTN